MLPETLLNPTSNAKPSPNVSSKPSSKPAPVRLDRVDALLEVDLDELEEKSKAIPINELTGGPQPPILGASESSTPPELWAGGPNPSLCEDPSELV